mmetsp:Transcript_28076/g.90509  ORF Transcript_28076/g.90509 Transcript_28076/m.90509 type:complete len:211 (+) Transcript_28076:695-1327(+)
MLGSEVAPEMRFDVVARRHAPRRVPLHHAQLHGRLGRQGQGGRRHQEELRENRRRVVHRPTRPALRSALRQQLLPRHPLRARKEPGNPGPRHPQGRRLQGRHHAHRPRRRPRPLPRLHRHQKHRLHRPHRQGSTPRQAGHGRQPPFRPRGNTPRPRRRRRRLRKEERNLQKKVPGSRMIIKEAPACLGVPTLVLVVAAHRSLVSLATTVC